MNDTKKIKAWKRNNPNKVREQKRRWREKHNPEIRKTFKVWRNRTKYNISKKNKKYIRNYRKRNREKIKIQQYALRHLKKILIKERGNKCFICNKASSNLDIHHKKYTNDLENLFLLCRGCHMKIHKGLISLKGGMEHG